MELDQSSDTASISLSVARVACACDFSHVSLPTSGSDHCELEESYDIESGNTLVPLISRGRVKRWFMLTEDLLLVSVSKEFLLLPILLQWWEVEVADISEVEYRVCKFMEELWLQDRYSDEKDDASKVRYDCFLFFASSSFFKDTLIMLVSLFRPKPTVLLNAFIPIVHSNNSKLM